MRRQMTAALLALTLLAACGQSAAAPTPTPAPVATEPAAATPTPAAAATEPAPAATEPAAAPSAPGQQLVVMSHDSFNASAEVIKAFEQQNNVSVKILQSGDAGSALNQAILNKNAPQADVFFGVDNTFLSRALDADIFAPYQSPALADLPAKFQLDPSYRLTPIDYGYISLNYDKAYLAQSNLAVPASLRDLTKPEWKGKLVVENPATSSPGLAFLLATVAEFGTSGDYTYLDFWKELRANDVLVSDGWDDAYNTQFSGASGKGPRPLVVSYTSSPPAEVIYSETPLTDAPTGVITAGSFLQVEFAGVLKGSKQPELAQEFIDFMLGAQFQEDMPLQMFVYPVLPSATLPEAFAKYSVLPESTKDIAPADISAHRDEWIDAWTQTVLR